jgi:hypothetical protein
MENIINKLNQINDEHDPNAIWKDWSWDEKKKLLDMYFIISQKENHIFDLIYKYHGCDSWEDIFRDYNIEYLNDKASGVKVAIDQIDEIIQRNKTQDTTAQLK